MKLTNRQKFIIVSNRLPVSIAKEDGKLIIKPSPGGLATAMASLEGSTAERIWIGWPGISSDELTAADKAMITRKLKGMGLYPVFLSSEQVKLFYEGYSNETIWPLFHYFKSIAEHHAEYWKAYVEVNKLYKQAVVRLADERATVWVHDYHLMILPKMIRQALPKSSIGFFLHIPFPSFELFRLLPNRKEILEGLLGADLVGFHVYDYVRHFTSSVLRTLGYESQNGSVILNDRVVRADAFPIGIDYKKFKTAVLSPEIKREVAHLDELYKDRKVILSVDRLDYSKGIANRLDAFELFLKENPSYHKKVTMVVIAVPSRTEVGAYKNLRDVIEVTVSRINGTYGTVDWSPISYQFKNLPFEELVALYAKAEVALVTPLRDGMNLVAKEYVASKQQNKGVLVLSELTGAVDELPEALIINPNDTGLVAQAIKKALTMPVKEQRKRLLAMQRRISKYTVRRWATDFIEQLADAQHDQMRRHNKLLNSRKKDELVQNYKTSKKRAVIFDYDGTLKSFVGSPGTSQASPSQSLLSLLKKFTDQPGTDLSIVSGRTKHALETWFGGLDATLVAEHGFWVKHNGEWSQESTDFKVHKQHILDLLELYAERTPGATVEEKDFSVVWHYRSVTPELAYARNKSLKHDLGTLLERTDIGVFSGNKIIEIKPRGITKGVVVDELLVNDKYDFILCCGDDYTDEDMFSALSDRAYTIHVGLGDTKAKHQIQSVDKLLGLLRRLV